MDNPMILYRGTLKSCNYHCSYCPFARRPMGKRELEQDRLQWEQFVQMLLENADSYFKTSIPARAVMVVPYGEALIHPWYWKGLGMLSAHPRTDAVGAQTNLSFPIESSLALYQQAGGDLAKLRLWATFHPEMITAEAFASACKKLLAAGVTLCAGAVGKPGNLEQIRRLRQALPKEIYLWINRMDGLDRAYTQEEVDAFWDIDPYFLRELVPVRAEPARCRGRLFVEGNRRVRLCNISRAVAGLDFSGGSVTPASPATVPMTPKRLPSLFTQISLCHRKFCSCYLAYGGRDDFMNRILFGPYPLFRIPRHPRAVFLDIMGTLIPKKTVEYDAGPSEDKTTVQTQEPLPEKLPMSIARTQESLLEKLPLAAQTPSRQSSGIPAFTLAGLEALRREQIPVFFATTLPYGDAMARCRGIRHLFSGGIFSGGAQIRLEQGDHTEEIFHYLPETLLEHMAELEDARSRFRYRILLYRNAGKLYKITLLRPGQLPWKEREVRELAKLLSLDTCPSVRYFTEDCCFQIVSRKASKELGVRTLCRWLGISPEETAAAGDGAEDTGMLLLPDESLKSGSLPV